MGKLTNKIETFLTTRGPEGIADLCRATGRSERTLRRWLKEGLPTSAHIVYRLAVAVGFTEAEAIKLGHECIAKKRSA